MTAKLACKVFRRITRSTRKAHSIGIELNHDSNVNGVTAIKLITAPLRKRINSHHNIIEEALLIKLIIANISRGIFYYTPNSQSSPQTFVILDRVPRLALSPWPS